LLKAGKDKFEAADFQPISLLGLTFKLLERVILNFIQNYIDKIVTIEQVGLRENKGWDTYKTIKPDKKRLKFQLTDDILIVHQSQDLKDGSSTIIYGLAKLSGYFYNLPYLRNK